MSAFDDMLEADAAIEADTDQFPGVETFTYHRDGAGAKRVTGSVFRERTEFDPVRMAPAKRLVVRVSKSQIASVDSPGDCVEVASILGGTPQKFSVKEILSQDAGVWELLL